MKPVEIFSGWINLIFKNENVEMVAKERAVICRKCQWLDVKLSIPECSVCGCPIAAKTRSMDSKCPKDKW